MILADKIILHRKRLEWSQEEFAYKMNVSRQAVSKWELAQSTPDLDKILLMSKLFGVTTDYLLLDSIEDVTYSEYDESTIKKVDLETAHEFLEKKEHSSKAIALGVSFCILASIPLILLTSLSEFDTNTLHPDAAAGIGLTLLIIPVAYAVYLFVTSYLNLNKFEYLSKEPFELGFGVESMVTQKMENYRSTYHSKLTLGIVSLILSAIPIFIGGTLFNDGMSVIYGVCTTLLIASLGVNLIVSTQIQWNAFTQLLQTGDFSKQSKQNNDILEPIAGVYWMSVVVLYLLISFTQNNWDISWIIFPIAGPIFGIIASLVTGFSKK